MPERIDFSGDPQVLPYDLAKRVWDDRIGSSVAQAKKWRQAAFFSTCVSVVAVVGAVWLGSLPKSVPYIVSIDDQRQAVNVFRLTHTEVTNADIQYFLGMFFRWIRSVSVDPAVIQQQYAMAYNFLAPTAQPIFSNHYNTYKPFERAKEETRIVDIRTTSPVTANTWQVRWTEKAYDLDGNQTGVSTWVAMVTVQRSIPTEDTIMKNPLGIYITNWNIQPDETRTK